MKTLAVITDAWAPQVNGVVTTMQTVLGLLREYNPVVIHPGLFQNFALPGYSEIRLANPWGIAEHLDALAPDAIHISTEGPLGWAAWLYCKRRGRKFTTSYHTQFPEYIQKRFGLPLGFTYGILRGFHNAAETVMINTPTMGDMLEARGFKNLRIWTRGVDTSRYSPEGLPHLTMSMLKGPIALNVGRVSVEKNLTAFYDMPFEGTKVQVGTGPQLDEYKRKYPKVVFLGQLRDEELAQAYRTADVFVFPSKSDTFGLVMLESMASGVPVAAFNVVGPRDVLLNGISGQLDDDLAWATQAALQLSPESAQRGVEQFTWAKSAQQFEEYLTR